MGLSVKDVYSQWGKKFVQCRHFADKGIIQLCTSALFGANTWDFSKFMICLHGQGVESVRTFCRQGEGSIFAFCADVFYRWPLSAHVQFSMHGSQFWCFYPTMCGAKLKHIVIEKNFIAIGSNTLTVEHFLAI